MADTLKDLKQVNVSITLTPDQLEAITDAAAEKARRAVEAEYKKQQAPETYYTTTQVRKLLNVAHQTLWRWDKAGVLKPVKIGGLNRYKKTDIDRITATN